MLLEAFVDDLSLKVI